MTKPKLPLAPISLLLLAGALALAIGWYAIKVFRAEMRVLDVRATRDEWAAQNTVPSLDEWEQTLRQAEEAIALIPNSAEYHRLLGVLHEWRGYSVNNQDVSLADLLAARRLAVLSYREGTRLRPNNAFAWASLARMKALAGERDDEFKQALRNAMRFGRNLDYIHAEVAFIAQLAWAQIIEDTELADDVKAAVIRGLEARESRNGVLEILEQSRLIVMFCLEREKLPADVLGACEPPQ